jgi:hypothetical protein
LGKINEMCIYLQICRPTEGTFVINRGMLKNLSLLQTTIGMGYIDKGDRMANNYSINWRTWKQTKNVSTSYQTI